MRKKHLIEIAGPDIPSAAFEKTIRHVKKAVADLELTQEMEVRQIMLYSPFTLEKYGYLKSPAVMLDGVVIIEGKVPTTEQIQEKLQDIVALIA